MTGTRLYVQDVTLRDRVLMADGVHAIAQAHVVQGHPFAAQIHACHPAVACVARSSPVRSAAAVMMSRLPAYFGR